MYAAKSQGGKAVSWISLVALIAMALVMILFVV